MILCVYYWIRSMVGLVRLASVVCFGSRDGLEYLSYDCLRNDFAAYTYQISKEIIWLILPTKTFRVC